MKRQIQTSQKVAHKKGESAKLTLQKVAQKKEENVKLTCQYLAHKKNKVQSAFYLTLH